ncbi:hypothetical protein [Mycobacteroides abscessus]|uniref:hypothetical protein n=1 Tax=Mycobacteroides abscessus TaxID=36809 RepID=UPI000C256A70|nr:hypothetical protein [Mycobacteroides abscessus]RIS08438.1 hypothetical protein D2E58_03005 [Mycobacteroides abscessus]
MTITRIWYHPIRKTKVQDQGQWCQLPDGRDIVDLFETFADKEINNDTLVRPDRETYARVTRVTRKGRSVLVETESGRFGEEVSVKNVKTHELKGKFTRDHAPIVVTHGVLLVPKTGTSALVFSERSAGQGGMTGLLSAFTEKFQGLYPDYKLKSATVVQTDAWLKHAKLTKVVGTVRKYTTDEATDTGDEVVGVLSHTLLPEKEQKYFPPVVWEHLRDKKINRAKFLNFAEGTELDTFDITVSDGSQSKTFEIGDERTPPIRLLLTDAGQVALNREKILKRVLDEAPAIFKEYGIEWSETDALAPSKK